MEDLKKFELSIDHPMLDKAKSGFNACLKAMVAKAIGTGSMEGTATLKISFEISDVTDGDTGEVYMAPGIKYKAQYAVPMKSGCEGTLVEKSRLHRDPERGWLMINGQITMDELMEEG